MCDTIVCKTSCPCTLLTNKQEKETYADLMELSLLIHFLFLKVCFFGIFISLKITHNSYLRVLQRLWPGMAWLWDELGAFLMLKVEMGTLSLSEAFWFVPYYSFSKGANFAGILHSESNKKEWNWSTCMHNALIVAFCSITFISLQWELLMRLNLSRRGKQCFDSLLLV